MIIYRMYLNWTYIFGKNFFSAVFWMDHIHFIDYICASVKRFALFSMKNRTHDFINFICVRLIEILNHRIFLWISISCVLQEILNMHLAEENWFIDSFVSFFFKSFITDLRFNGCQFWINFSKFDSFDLGYWRTRIRTNEKRRIFRIYCCNTIRFHVLISFRHEVETDQAWIKEALDLWLDNLNFHHRRCIKYRNPWCVWWNYSLSFRGLSYSYW